jgi:magnesium-transporting ATPase (P-type)
MSETKEINYWKLQKDELVKELNSSAMGLDDTEAARRLEEYGLNEIPSIERRTSFSIFAAQFKNPLVYVLVFASCALAYLSVCNARISSWQYSQTIIVCPFPFTHF